MKILSKKHLLSSIAIIVASFLSSCVQYSSENPPPPNPAQTKIQKAIFVNPYPVGSYAHFKANPSYRKTYEIWKDNALFNSTSKSQTRIVISLSQQRAIMYNGDRPIMDYPVSTGKSQFPTPKGNFTVVEMKEKDKRSNLYGKIYDATGSVVKSNADSGKDAGLIAQEGNRFEGALMAYWMRLTWDGIGMHRGNVPRYPASHGCIRTYSKAVSSVFSKVKLGTPVSITH